ncbi:hypothetical protein ENTB43_086 [Enterobacter phage Entb_43]|nr:hypothetical protein ENTB43_086 [Enterobacter phage Entb_43]
MKPFSEFLNEGVFEIKTHFISKGLTGYTDTPEDKTRFTNDVKALGLGNSSDAGKAWKSFQVTKEIFAPGKSVQHTVKNKSSVTDAEVKALEKAWADVKTAYDKAAALSGEMLKKVQKDNQGVEVHIKRTPALYSVLNGLQMSRPSEDFSKRIAQIRGFVNDVVKFHKKL